MQWDKDTLRENRLKLGFSQTALAEGLGVHFRTVQNWEKGVTSITTWVHPALDKILCQSQDMVPREEYDRVVSALNFATELNRKLSDIIQSNAQGVV
jgi:transcriptional regulator with XRE-family HTH domain